MTEKMTRWILTLTALTIGLPLTVISARTANSAWAEPTPAATEEVRIDNFSFAPQTVTVPVGTTVHWTNRDDIPHTVVSEDKTTFKSKALDSDEDFTFTFTQPGTYNYFCSVHPKMRATVVVK
jgi:plastocyanin